MSNPRRHTFVRPMDNWWLRDPFFIRYMAREATAIFVALYALILLVGLLRLGQGRAAFEGWLEMLQSGPSIALHLVLLAGFAYHTVSWFSIMPKTMAPVMIGGKRLAASTITAAGIAVAVVVSAIVVFVALKVAL